MNDTFTLDELTRLHDLVENQRDTAPLYSAQVKIQQMLRKQKSAAYIETPRRLLSTGQARAIHSAMTKLNPIKCNMDVHLSYTSINASDTGCIRIVNNLHGGVEDYNSRHEFAKAYGLIPS